MKVVSAALATHLASETTSMATCWLVRWTNGTVKAFTDHDVDLTFNLESALTANALPVPPEFVGSGSQTYLAATGYTATDVKTSSALNVDDLNVEGFIAALSVSDDDLNAGRWDYAAFLIVEVNWADLTQGPLVKRVGHIGEVSLGRSTFNAELRGLLQLYSRGIIEVSSPSCRYILGDARCTKNLAAFTVTGTVTSINPDNMTFGDTARVEAGPTGGKTITAITQATLGVVTAVAHGFSRGQIITIRGVLGMTQVNTVHIVNAVLTVDTIRLGTDTTTFGAYTSGGTATPLGGDDDGYFTYGLVTFTAAGSPPIGFNAGLSREVKSYVPGIFVLQEPMPYAIAVGDHYTAVAGCNKDFFTGCKVKFNNAINFGGEPYVPGTDKMMQVARHT